MDPLYNLQDLVRCIHCETSKVNMYCKTCHTHVCKDCKEKHSFAFSKTHEVLSLKQYITTLNNPKCLTHPMERCEFHCEQCDIQICEQCIYSKKHSGHIHIDIMNKYESKKEILERDLQEAEKYISPIYEEIAVNITSQKVDLKEFFQNMTTAINKQGEVWHREIDTILKNLKSYLEEMESKHLVVLNTQEDEITRTISEITQTIAEIRKLLNSKDVCLVYEYKSRNVEFRKLPPKIKVSLPIFMPKEIQTSQLIKKFGYLSELSFTTEVQDYSMLTKGADFSPYRPLINIPQVIIAIDTLYRGLYGVTCLNDTEIWTCGWDMMKLYNLRGNLLKSIQTKSGNDPRCIAVTRSGDLVYADYIDRTVNIVENTQIQTVIRLRGWRPCSVCSTSSGDLLVVMNSVDKQTKVVRYSGSTKKQSIQVSGKGQPLYSCDGDKYICENRNLDICVSDNKARAVVVVNQAGELRFTYTGPPSTTTDLFNLHGIATDSQGLILTADWFNDRIHILDQDGQFLRYIEECDLDRPCGLCVDTRDNLFVVEIRTGKVKKIQYYK